MKNAGEGRFVFGVLDNGGQPLPFTVILEYEQIATSRAQLRGWAQQWHALGALAFGEPFNAALQQITEDARAAEWEEITPEDDGKLLFQKPVWQRLVIMFGGVAMYLLLAFLLFLGVTAIAA